MRCMRDRSVHVTVHEQIYLHTAHFSHQNRVQIDTIKSKQRHHHRGNAVHPPHTHTSLFHDGVRICVSIFFYGAIVSQTVSFMCLRAWQKMGRDAVYLSTPRLISSVHTYTVDMSLQTHIYLLFKRVNSGNSQIN